MKTFVQSKKFKIALIVLGELVVLLLVFHLGILVGYRKAHFSYRWGENYHRNFGGPREGFFGNFHKDEYISSHGTFGSIVKIEGNTLIIKGEDNVERTALILPQTFIRGLTDNLSPHDLKVGDRVVILGSPNEQGQIEAKFIRLFPKS